MINNRQGGRRRGRGGQRGQNPSGQSGNRQDNRQRGNAAQLLEKYKSMARDAQLSGDRVQTEYYLQFADHYFRMLGESRSRFDEQRKQRGDDGDDGGDDDGDEEFAEAEAGEADVEERDERPARRNPPRRNDGDEQRPQRRASNSDRNDNPGRGEEQDRGNRSAETIPFDVLPPAIGRDEDDKPADEERKPRRRARAARPADSDDEVAPAA